MKTINLFSRRTTRTFIMATVVTMAASCSTAQKTDKLHLLKFDSQQQVMDYFHYTGHDEPIVSGHRGGALPGFPENCIPTFEHTLSKTTAVFEIDPHLTKDSEMVLLHDATLERVTTGKGKLNQLNLDALNKLRLKDLDGKPTAYPLNTLQEAVAWCKGKTMLNLDVKDVPVKNKLDLVKKMDAFNYVMFTVHDSQEARAFYELDNRSFFSAWILDQAALDAYEKSGIPWSHFLMAYIGPELNAKNQELTNALHQRGVMVMIGAGPTYDTLPNQEDRASAYRKAIESGVDIIESDRPIEVAAAIESLSPKTAPQLKYQVYRAVQ